MANYLITGCNRGLGLGMTKLALESGNTVYATCRNIKSASNLQLLKESYPEHLHVHELDVVEFAAVDDLATELKAVAIDILINNAGIYGGRSHIHETIEFDTWEKVFKVNVLAPLKVTQSFLPQVKKSKSKKIAFITSKMGSISDNTSGGKYDYRSSKAALNCVAYSLSHDLKKDGVSVIILHPGWVRTDMGGPSGLIDVETSTTGLLKQIDGLTLKNSGEFKDYAGKTIAW